MRLLFLAKRQPQSRCLVERPYGRFHHLPTGLAARGHAVTLALIGHRGEPAGRWQREGVTVHALDLRGEGPRAVWSQLQALTAEAQPDWIVGASDLWYGIAAVRLAHRLGCRAAIDSYDDFEAYLPWALPAHALWRRALRQAALRTAAGPQLAARLQQLAGGASVHVVPMAADPEFHPRDRRRARAELDLPAEVPLAGYLGSLMPGRAIETLRQALPRIAAAVPALAWRVSGRRSLAVPAGVEHLGYLPDAAVPTLLAALDLALVTAAPGRFGLGSYPSKLYEALASGVPVVAADLPNLRWIAGDAARYYRPGDAASLAEAVITQCRAPRVAPPPAGWEAAVLAMERVLLAH